MGKSLVIVESPTKVKTLAKYLGRDFTIKASVGHVMDLPKSKLGVEISDESFDPVYEVIKGKKKVLDDITSAAKKVDTVYLAPDPDREGEAIAWHIAGQLSSKPKVAKKTKTKAKAKAKKAKPEKELKICRILIEEITKKGVTTALAAPRDLNLGRYESQQARRILDRLVGYQVSPILWDKVRRGLSAGRVQSVALRIIVEREREIQKFVPVEYWTIESLVHAKNPPPFALNLLTKNGKKIEISNEAQATEILDELKKQDFIVSKITKKERKRTPQAPFTTSSLQQEAARKLGFTAKKTMILAQQLYEGIELGDEGAVGLITYMRTDSTRLSDDALNSAREFISEEYGSKYLPAKPRAYKVKKRAQDAHEAIRPTMMNFPPARLSKLLERDKNRLYRLIWDRFIACQMTDAVYDQTGIDVKAGDYGLRATGSILKKKGFMKIYVEGKDDADGDEDGLKKLPSTIEEGEKLRVEEITPSQHFTKPPPRFTEASLVKELEEDGIGRPSTYASILSTLQDRKYAEKEQGRFSPTELGTLVCDLLVESFPDIFNVKFTATMEDQLDLVEEGDADWQKILRDFYKPFAKDLKDAKKKMRDVKREETPTEHVCEKCGKTMVIKFGRHGHFLACSGYPDCKSTKEFKRAEDGKINIVEQEQTKEVCEECKAPMTIKHGRFGKFLACTKYPECKHTRSISSGVSCPEPDCKGYLAERRSKRGRTFYGCSKYPKCKHATWYKPVPKPCPDCKAPYLVEKYTKKDGPAIACANKECSYKELVS